MVAKPKKEIWFKARPFGWGWYPATWQGWFVVYAAVGAIFYGVHDAPELEAAGMTEAEILPLLLTRIGIPVVVLIAISIAKGEKSEWRWSWKSMENDWKEMSQLDRKVHILGILGLIAGIIAFAMYMSGKSA